MEPYTNKSEFTAALDRWAEFYSKLRRDPEEAEEATILRLAEQLSKNATILQVTSFPHCIYINTSDNIH